MPNDTPVALPQVAVSWSGGKDCTLALYQLLQSNQYQVRTLLTTLNATNGRVTMHGVREALLDAQAAALGLPLKKVYLPESPSLAQYSQLMGQAWAELRAEGITAVAFGDVFLEDLRQYRQTELAAVGLRPLFPLWQQSTDRLTRQFVAAGFRAVVVCINNRQLDGRYLGQIVDESFLAGLPTAVDVGGERGEYHTFVFDGPLFATPVAYQPWEKVVQILGPANNTYDTEFTYLDLLPILPSYNP